MESINVEPQETLLHDQTETSSTLKQEAAPQSPFHTGSERPYRDSSFTFLFLTAILTTFTFGIIASTRTDTLNMDTKLRLSHYNPTTNKCEITQQQAPKASDSALNSDSALVALSSLLLLALAQTIPFSLLVVFLLRRYTQTLVVMPVFVVFLVILGLGLSAGLLVGLWLFSWCLDVPEVWVAWNKIFYLVFESSASAQFGYMLWMELNGSSVENGVEVLRMATRFLKEHFVLLVVNPVLLMGAMVVVNGPIFTFMWYAFNVGEVVPDFDVVNDPIKGCGLGTGVRCCREEHPGWVYAYITFCNLHGFLGAYGVNGSSTFGSERHCLALVQFAPKGSSAIGNIKRSLRNAYGPPFGSACNLGTIVTTLVVALVRFLKKKLSDGILKSNNQGMMLSILQGCSSWMSQFPEHYPQLPSIFLGIWESSKKLDQNLLQQTSPILTTMSISHDYADEGLICISVICALLQTFVVYEVLEYLSNAFVWTKLLIAIGYCFPIIMLTGYLQAIFSVMKSVIVCFAMEKDVGVRSKVSK